MNLKLLTGAFLIITSAAIAGETIREETSDITLPKQLAGATITVKLADGTEYKMKSEEYAVVPRKQKGPKRTIITRTEDGHPTARPNTIKAFGGVGSNGIKSKQQGDAVKVEQGYGANYGVGYERDVTEDVSVEVIGTGNKNGINGGLFGVGYKF